jgi:hypothetical protein
MKCPHCTISFHDNWDEEWIKRGGRSSDWAYRTAVCPECSQWVIELAFKVFEKSQQQYVLLKDWDQVYPRGSNRGPAPPEIPDNVRMDYVEACVVLPLSAKASAALSRRCLQNILRAHGYKAPSLAQEIDLLLNENDLTKAIPATLRTMIDGIRHF